MTSDDVENHKPSPDTFLKVAEQLNVIPSQCIVFEDTRIGQQAASNAGMDCYLVHNGTVLSFSAAVDVT